MIAGLPMYDWPEERSSVDALWDRIAAELRSRGIAAPDRLSRDLSIHALWEHPRLLLGQSCSLPYRQRLHGRVELLGAFDPGLPDTPPGCYHSVIVARAGTDDLPPTPRLAFNGFDSQSGWAAAVEWASGQAIPLRSFVHTGAHRESAHAVAAGEADVAAIDAVTWRLVRRHMPEVATGLRVIARTRPTPALPLICARGMPTTTLREALAAAAAELPAALARRLSIRGFVALPATAYLALSSPDLPSQGDPVPLRQATSLPLQKRSRSA